MARSRVLRYVATLFAALSLALVIPVASRVPAQAADPIQISATDLAKEAPLLVQANEDISNRSLVAVRLANYTQAVTDGTNLIGLDVVDAGYAAIIDKAIKDAEINTTGKVNFAYDAANPMPWVMENLLQAATNPWEDTTPPNLRAFLTNLRTALSGDNASARVANTTATLNTPAQALNGVEDKNTQKTADVMPGVYMILDDTAIQAGVDDSKTDDDASIPMVNGTGVYYNGTVLTTLKKSADKSYTLGEVEYKATHVTVDKKVTGPQDDAAAGEQAHAAIGQDVTFTLTTQVPNYTGYDKMQLKLRDTLGAGLTFKEITSVKVDDKALADGMWKKVEPADVTDNGTGSNDKDYTFEIVFAPGTDNVSNLLASAETKAAFPVGKTVTVTYTATLDKDAVIQSNGNLNTVETRYSHNPNDSSDLEKTPPSTTKVYTGQISLKKTDTSGKVLSGAEFNIFKGDETTAAKVTVVQAGDASTPAIYRLADATETSAEATMTVPASGLLVIQGLDGSYKVKETASPFGTAGILLPSFTTTVTTTETSTSTPSEEPEGKPVVTKQVTTVATTNGDDTLQLVADTQLSASTTDVTATTVTFTVENPRNLLDMPKTGAAWLVIYAIAALLFGGAGFALVWKARKN